MNYAKQDNPQNPFSFHVLTSPCFLSVALYIIGKGLRKSVGYSELRSFLLALCDVPEQRNLAYCSIGVNIRCRHYLINFAGRKATFPLLNNLIVNDIRYATYLLARVIEIMQMFVARQTSTLTKSIYYVGIHKPNPVVRTSDDDTICHSIYDF